MALIKSKNGNVVNLTHDSIQYQFTLELTELPDNIVSFFIGHYPELVEAVIENDKTVVTNEIQKGSPERTIDVG